MSRDDGAEVVVITEGDDSPAVAEAAVTTSRVGWWRRNRVGLALLPVALVAALAGNAQRLQTLWWEADLRSPQRPDASGVVRFVDEYDDGHHVYPITPELSVVSVERASTLPGYDGSPEPVTLPSDAMLWKVRLHVEADPSAILVGCDLALVDEQGTRWQSGSRAFTSEANEPASPARRPTAPAPAGCPGRNHLAPTRARSARRPTTSTRGW